MHTYQIDCKIRDELGRRKSKVLRNNGMVPAVIYGHNEKTIHISVEKEKILSIIRLLKGEPALFEIALNNKKKTTTIIKEYQKNILTDKLQHIDFQFVHKGEPLKISIPVITKGSPEGVKAGGIIEVSTREVDIEAIPSKLPEHIEIDITDLNIGQGLHIKDIDFGDVLCHNDPNQMVVSVIAPRAIVSATAEKEGEEEEDEEEKSPSETETS